MCVCVSVSVYVDTQIYLTGHGGDGFVKFSDTSELMAQDLADAMEQMSEKKR